MKETIDVTPAELESLVMSKRRRDYILYVLRNLPDMSLHQINVNYSAKTGLSYDSMHSLWSRCKWFIERLAKKDFAVRYIRVDATELLQLRLTKEERENIEET
jgi:hypothetical protein